MLVAPPPLYGWRVSHAAIYIGRPTTSLHFPVMNVSDVRAEAGMTRLHSGLPQAAELSF